MQSISVLFQKLKHGGVSLAEHERACLVEFAKSLDEPLREIIYQQIAGIAYVQHQNPKMTLILFEPPVQGTMPLFKNRAYGKAATVTGKLGTLAITCTIFVAEGRILALQYSAPITSALRRESFAASRCKVLQDLLLPAANTQLTRERGPLLRKIELTYPISNVRESGPRGQIDALLESLAQGLPPDFEQLLNETDQFDLPGWSFAGVAGRTLTAPDCNLRLTFENADGTRALCFKEDSSDAKIYVYEEINEHLAEAPGATYVDALLELVRLSS